MIARSFWDEDPRFLDGANSGTLRENLRQVFDTTSFCSTKHYVCVITMRVDQLSRSSIFDFNVKLIRGVEIAEALTTTTRTKDLADAFAWIEGVWSSHDASHNILQRIRDRARSVHGITTSHGSVPVPSGALNNEVAYMIFTLLQLQFDVRLTGLHSAAHLNGRHGDIRSRDPESHERWKAYLDDGRCVRVLAVNLEHILRKDHRRRLP
jgi:hypothetical protein